jgi:hypothetical protein
MQRLFSGNSIANKLTTLNTVRFLKVGGLNPSAVT